MVRAIDAGKGWDEYIRMADVDRSYKVEILEPAAAAYYAEAITAYKAATGKEFHPAGNSGGGTIYRLWDGIERFLITDINNPAATARAQSELAIMWDFIGMDDDDGYVEWLRYPNENHPITMFNGLVGRLF